MIQSLLQFLDASPVNFLAAANVAKALDKAGYTRLDPSEPMPPIESGQRFYVTRNSSAVFAFEIGRKPLSETGIHLICAHSDSPTFRIKPNAEMLCEGGILKLNTEVYGGAILNTWFDRPLSLAGRVMLRGSDALHPEERLLHIKRPLMQIPNLAIHFNRQVNDGVKLSRQKDTLPIMAYIPDTWGLSGNVLLKLIASELNVETKDIIDFDLSLYDTTPACTFGLIDEFISSGRLDDLSMVHAGLTALTDSAPSDTTKVLAIFDNEETGSNTNQGAGSPFLANMLQRIVMAQGGSLDDYFRMAEKSFLISADNAHAWHPNHGEKMDPTNHPQMGRGPVIKYNAAQKYMTDAHSAAVFASICLEANVRCQTFVNHSDIAGGSTLGSILITSLPIKGVDMGNPVWAMHSARETANVEDHLNCIRVFTKFYEL